MKNKLFLASHSSSRKLLLQEAQIPFTCINQNADEKSCSWNQQPSVLVRFLAELKMAHAQIPEGKDGDICFVLTADTVGYDSAGIIYGKSESREQALQVLKKLEKSFIATAFCLEKKQLRNNVWHTLKKTTQVIESSCTFSVPDYFLERYLSTTDALESSGSLAIEGYGLQFLKEIHGSYTGIRGLPLCEVREALTSFGFFDE